MTILILIVVCIVCILIFSKPGNDKQQNEHKIESSIAEESKIPTTDIKETNPAGGLKTSPIISEKKSVTTDPEPYRAITPHEQENEQIKEGILKCMKKGESYTISSMLQSFDCFPSTMTVNRLAALLSQLGPNGTRKVERYEANGMAYFSLPDYEEYEETRTSNVAESQLTPHQLENEQIKDGILKCMEKGKSYTISEMMNSFDCLPPNMDVLRLASLLSQLGPNGNRQLERYESNGKAYFSLPDYEDNNGIEVELIEKRPESAEDPGDSGENEIDYSSLLPYQAEEEAIKEGILDCMETDKSYTVSAMLQAFDCFPNTMTRNRLAALLSQLGPYGCRHLERYEKYGKTFYYLSPKGIRKKESITPEQREHRMDILGQGGRHAYSGASGWSEYQSDFAESKKKRRTVYYTDWDGRKYYYDKNGVKKYKQERVYQTDWDGREYYINKNGEKKYRQERKQKMNDEEYYDPAHYNNFQNGATDHGTFIGTCKLCGAVWEFQSREVIPVPYPHGTCPKCHQWVAVF